MAPKKELSNEIEDTQLMWMFELRFDAVFREQVIQTGSTECRLRLMPCSAFGKCVSGNTDVVELRISEKSVYTLMLYGDNCTDGTSSI